MDWVTADGLVSWVLGLGSCVLQEWEWVWELGDALIDARLSR